MSKNRTKNIKNPLISLAMETAPIARPAPQGFVKLPDQRTNRLW
jgi:hypothetical protein